MKRILLLIMAFVLFLSACGGSNNKTTSENKSGGVSFNENYFTNDELIRASNYIIKGEVLKLKEKSVKSVQANANGETYEIKIPYVIYSVKVIESLKTPTNNTTIDLVFVEGTDSSIKVGEKYVLFLEDNSKSKVLNKSYSLVSMIQGVYSFIENSNVLQCSLMSENKTESEVGKTYNMNYDVLKQKCEELK